MNQNATEAIVYSVLLICLTFAFFGLKGCIEHKDVLYCVQETKSELCFKGE